MKNISIICIFLLFLGSAWGRAAEQSLATPASCQERLDISALPAYTSFIKTDLPDLEDYFTCKAAVKEDIQICNIFSDGSPQRASCQTGYNDYYATFGKLFKNGRMSKELLDACLKNGDKITKEACEQWSKVMLSGNPDDCEKIEGITPENVAQCKDMASSNPSGSTAFFMMVLRKGDPALCDQISSSSAAGAICKGLLSKNGDGCQLNAGANRFKELYCQHIAQ
jgi:hypothetical protein